MLLTNDPVPVPSVVWFPETVGLFVVPQQIPLAVIGAPPSELILPPEVAELEVTALAEDVVRAGKTAPIGGLWLLPPGLQLKKTIATILIQRYFFIN